MSANPEMEMLVHFERQKVFATLSACFIAGLSVLALWVIIKCLKRIAVALEKLARKGEK